MHNLLQLPTLEQSYLSDGLLIVPIVEQAMQEQYWMEIEGTLEQKETGRDLFILFRSLNLGEARHKMFTDKYLFMSHEVNILNMLLSGKEEETDPPPA